MRTLLPYLVPYHRLHGLTSWTTTVTVKSSCYQLLVSAGAQHTGSSIIRSPLLPCGDDAVVLQALRLARRPGNVIDTPNLLTQLRTLQSGEINLHATLERLSNVRVQVLDAEGQAVPGLEGTHRLIRFTGPDDDLQITWTLPHHPLFRGEYKPRDLTAYLRVQHPLARLLYLLLKGLDRERAEIALSALGQALGLYASGSEIAPNGNAAVLTVVGAEEIKAALHSAQEALHDAGLLTAYGYCHAYPDLHTRTLLIVHEMRRRPNSGWPWTPNGFFDDPYSLQLEEMRLDEEDSADASSRA